MYITPVVRGKAKTYFCIRDFLSSVNVNTTSAILESSSKGKSGLTAIYQSKSDFERKNRVKRFDKSNSDFDRLIQIKRNNKSNPDFEANSI